MQNPGLHDALTEFAVEASALLAAELDAGAEIRFDVVEEPRRGRSEGPVLYSYRPLTSEFVAERWPLVRELPSCAPAARALGPAAAAYLRVRGLSGVEAEPALRAMLERLFEESTVFTFPEERFERVYAEVERTLYEGAIRSLVLAPVHGLELESERFDLDDGLAIVSSDAAGPPGEALAGGAGALLVLELTIPADEPLPIAEAHRRFTSLIRALRLFKAGALGPEPVGWARAGDSPWKAVALGVGGEPRGEPWVLHSAEEAELLEFVAILERSRVSGVTGWALGRFVMGAERRSDSEGISDHLLALRALLDGTDDDAGRASLSLRLAALCADEGGRRAVQRRVEQAIALERMFMRGAHDDSYLEIVGSESPRALALEVEDLLRSLLRDLICGYLDPGLKTLADDILLASGEPLEIRARDLRRERRRQPATGSEVEMPPEAEAEALQADEEAPTGELDALELGDDPGEGLEHWEAGPDDGVTPSADWGLDEDPADYSAPV